jgi:hypothetical protein
MREEKEERLTKKEWHANPVTVLKTTIVCSMNGTLIAIVCQSSEEIPDIDYNGPRNGLCPDPFVLGAQDLQATRHILPQQGEALNISVGADSHVTMRCRQLLGCKGSIEIKATVRAGKGGDRIKVVFWQRE